MQTGHGGSLPSASLSPLMFHLLMKCHSFLGDSPGFQLRVRLLRGRAAAGPALHPLCSLAMCSGWAAFLSPPAPGTAWLSSWAGPGAWTWVRGQRPHWAAPSSCNGSDQRVYGSTFSLFDLQTIVKCLLPWQNKMSLKKKKLKNCYFKISHVGSGTCWHFRKRRRLTCCTS